ncbi:MAG: hypothetical protein U0401_21175 [Anaerolineae bacterium]
MGGEPAPAVGLGGAFQAAQGIVVIHGQYAADQGVGAGQEVGSQAAAAAGQLLTTTTTPLRRNPQGR